MRIKKVVVKNFRGYNGEILVSLGDFTALVGENDIGKSSVLEALDVFFNDGKGVVKLEKTDINIKARDEGDNEISITVVFSELPQSLVIDDTGETTLGEEYLLNADGDLEIVKRYLNAGSAKIFIRALHPQNPECCDLLAKKDSELRKILEKKCIPAEDRRRNATMRKAIWGYYGNDIQLEPVEIEVSKKEYRSIWDKLQKYLPIYSLFQADRKNSDGDSEVQDPLHTAVKEFLQREEIQEELDAIAEKIRERLEDVSRRTLEKLKEMSPEIADELHPVIPATSDLQWANVFKNVSIAGDQDIPINKRGSGTKRLILLNFFRAEVERRQSEQQSANVIYAIEEPETSQHSDNQRKLIRALMELSTDENTQVLITTHSPIIVKSLGFSNIRVIKKEDGKRIISDSIVGCLPYPSLNEVNYAAFSEISEEYHDELYGYMTEKKWLKEYSVGKPRLPYTRVWNGKTREETTTLTKYVRDVMHHPENTSNPRYTLEQLKESIELMREFLKSKL